MQMASAFQAIFSFSAPLPAEVIGHRTGLGSRIEPDGGASTDAPRAAGGVELDNPSTMPEVLGREAKVTFL